MSNCQRLTVGSLFDGLLEKGFILLAWTSLVYIFSFSLDKKAYFPFISAVFLVFSGLINEISENSEKSAKVYLCNTYGVNEHSKGVPSAEGSVNITVTVNSLKSMNLKKAYHSCHARIQSTEKSGNISFNKSLIMISY